MKDALPFTYESNGEETRFRDLRDPKSRSRVIFGVPQPDQLRAWAEQSNTLRARLQKLPPLDTRGLGDCQVEAIKGLEKSFAQQHGRGENVDVHNGVLPFDPVRRHPPFSPVSPHRGSGFLVMNSARKQFYITV